MFNQRFGQYLVGKHLITQQQLFEVLAYELNVRLKIGVMAVNAGLMTADQVEEVCREQRTADKWFGQIAIEKGYLTDNQFADLLKTQSKGFLSLSQAILDKGYLTLAQLEDALQQYKQFSKLTNEQWRALQTVDFDHIVRTFLNFSEIGSRAEIYYNYTAVMLRNIVRFLNEEAIVECNSKLPVEMKGWLVSQNITGVINMVTALNFDDECLLAAANHYSKEGFKAAEPIVGDCIAEFLNIVNGVFCATVSENGMELLMHPQQVRKGIIPANTKGYMIPITLSFGRMNLILVVD